MPPVPPPAARDKFKPPPRPAKASSLQHNTQNDANASGSSNSSSARHQHNSHHVTNQQALQQQPTHIAPYLSSNTEGYVGLRLDPQLMANSTSPQRTKTQQNGNHANHMLVGDDEKTQNHSAERNKFGNIPITMSPTRHASSFVSTSSSSALNGSPKPLASILTSQQKKNVFDFINTPTNLTQTPHSNHSAPLHHQQTATSTTPKTPLTPSSATLLEDVDEIIEYSDVADSIRRYDVGGSNSALLDAPKHSKSSSITSTSSAPLPSKTNFNRFMSPSHENLLRTDQKFQKLSPEKYDQLIGIKDAANAERLLQEHADDIELYVDPCDYASLKEIGLPFEEIKEMSKKLKQEQKDEVDFICSFS